MPLITNVVIVIIGLMHAWFLVLEMFLWDRPSGRRAFGTTAEYAASTKVLAANQGLYNGFLAAGLLWSVSLAGAEALHVKLFFLACVLVAGLYGGLTATRKALWIQALPAAIGLALVLLGGVPA